MELEAKTSTTRNSVIPEEARTIRRTTLWDTVFKRLTDILLSLITLLFTLPVSLLLSILIKFSAKGPVLFRQERIGKNGKPFVMLKFRTMKNDAETDGPMLSNPNDQRVTTVGRFMRRHKIDELPNFINVIRGEMSIVGPRPEREFYLDQLRKLNPDTDLMLTIKPGITCIGQVKFGYATNMTEMAERLLFELEYVRKRSFRLDIQVMWHTILLLLRGREDNNRLTAEQSPQ
jgi:lipopolysaccharide/colanic/teichoic acid biosynthesis glycosyltransferase